MYTALTTEATVKKVRRGKKDFPKFDVKNFKIQIEQSSVKTGPKKLENITFISKETSSYIRINYNFINSYEIKLSSCHDRLVWHGESVIKNNLYKFTQIHKAFDDLIKYVSADILEMKILDVLASCEIFPPPEKKYLDLKVTDFLDDNDFDKSKYDENIISILSDFIHYNFDDFVGYLRYIQTGDENV